jgi:predicted nuclease of predicted toxin-antitoxin system
MKFLTDQDVYAATVGFLQGMGHDVVTASQLGLGQAADSEILQAAHDQNRLLVTRDRDFGGLVFVQGASPGVIYLRLMPSTLDPVHAELERVLTSYTETELQGSFVVVEPGRHRMRKPPASQPPESPTT